MVNHQILQASGLDPFQAFIIGFMCGIESDTDRMNEQIKIIKELDYKQSLSQYKNDQGLQDQKTKQKLESLNKSEKYDDNDDYDDTPPVDEIDHQKTDMFTEQSNCNKQTNNYLKGLQKRNEVNQSNTSDQNGSTRNDDCHGEPDSNKNYKDKYNVIQRQDSDFDMKNYMRQFEYQEEEEQKTLELIRQLQDQEVKDEQSRRMRIQENDEIDCPICMCELYTEKVLALENCDHVFHKECLLEYIKNKIMERKAQIICPDEECKTDILIDDFKQLLGKEMYELYMKYSLESYVDEHGDEISWCPTPDCKYVFAYDENQDESFFKCLMCKKQYCLKCRVAYHDGMSCKEYEVNNKKDENDLKFEKFVKGKKFKQCIKCKFWVEKNHGCNHMTCRCRYEFCYKCGGKYRECDCVQKQQEQQKRLQERRLARQKQKVQKNKQQPQKQQNQYKRQRKPQK